MSEGEDCQEDGNVSGWLRGWQSLYLVSRVSLRSSREVTSPVLLCLQ